MKHFAAVLILSVTAPFIACAQDGVLTGAERSFLVEQLELSKKNMLESIAGLSPAQWTYKPAPGRWSVQECAEHIVLAEGFLTEATAKILTSPAVARPEKSNAEVDHKVVEMVGDRSHKMTAPEPIVPSGSKFATPADAAAAFIAARDKSIEYAKTTNDPLRVHVAPGPAGPMDDYQFLLLMAAHTGRHTLQIKEVEASAGYPAK